MKVSEVKAITYSFQGIAAIIQSRIFRLSVVCKHRDSTVQTITLPVLFGFATWSLTLREEDWLRVFESTVLRETFGTEWDKVTKGWRKLCN